eukprot:2796501-Alexandrium_andersonii.AAC.1
MWRTGFPSRRATSSRSTCSPSRGRCRRSPRRSAFPGPASRAKQRGALARSCAARRSTLSRSTGCGRRMISPGATSSASTRTRLTLGGTPGRAM